MRFSCSLFTLIKIRTQKVKKPYSFHSHLILLMATHTYCAMEYTGKTSTCSRKNQLNSHIILTQLLTLAYFAYVSDPTYDFPRSIWSTPGHSISHYSHYHKEGKSLIILMKSLHQHKASWHANLDVIIHKPQ